MADTKTSTLQSYVDSATGAVQNTIGSITGSQTEQAKGQAKQDKVQVEYNASHTTVKGPGFSASSSGAVAKDDDRRPNGQWNQTVGSAKETIGNLVGSEDLKKQGRDQNLEGQGQEAKGQMSDYGNGVGDRVTGAVGGAVAGLTGDREEQVKYQDLHDKGKTLQRGVEHDVQQRAFAEVDAEKEEKRRE